jgi:NAD(P)-dependent dehydrogenase (short-subunit alcohol dehydrogenase family)
LIDDRTGRTALVTGATSDIGAPLFLTQLLGPAMIDRGHDAASFVVGETIHVNGGIYMS